MFTVRLKDGNTIEVPLEKLEDFLEKNQEQIEIQQKEMGKRRVTPVSANVNQQ